MKNTKRSFFLQCSRKPASIRKTFSSDTKEHIYMVDYRIKISMKSDNPTLHNLSSNETARISEINVIGKFSFQTFYFASYFLLKVQNQFKRWRASLWFFLSPYQRCCQNAGTGKFFFFLFRLISIEKRATFLYEKYYIENN